MQVKSDAPGNALIRRWINWEKEKSAAGQVTKDRKIIRENSGASRLWKLLRGVKELCWASCCDNLELVVNTVPCSPLLVARQASEPGCHSSHRGCAVWEGCHPTSCF